jgi:hypothetical protein
LTKKESSFFKIGANHRRAFFQVTTDSVRLLGKQARTVSTFPTLLFQLSAIVSNFVMSDEESDLLSSQSSQSCVVSLSSTTSQLQQLQEVHPDYNCEDEVECLDRDRKFVSLRVLRIYLEQQFGAYGLRVKTGDTHFEGVEHRTNAPCPRGICPPPIFGHELLARMAIKMAGMAIKMAG